MTSNLKKIAFLKRGDILEVKLRDHLFNVIYKKEVQIKNKAKLKELREELEKKGVSFPADWP